MAKGKRWFKLDNAGKLYPAISTEKWSSTFRVSAELRQAVDPALLQKAADRVMPRFPSLKVRMRAGVFWYYLEEISEPLTVRPDTGHPCMPFRYKQDHGYLMRVVYYRSRVSAEFFHSLTDGSGGFIFLKTLIAEYLRLQGRKIPCGDGVLDLRQKADPRETKDAFLDMPLPKIRVSRKEGRAYHYPATPEIPHTLHTIAASMPCAKVKEQARLLDVTVTEYLASAILYAACQNQKEQRKKRLLPVRVSVPVNMRAFYDSPTLRNFSSFVNPGVDPRLGDYTFPEIAAEVKAFLRYQVNPRLLSATIATNVADERNLLIRLVPLIFKNLVISSIFRRSGDKQVTATLSNLGVAKMPEGMEKWVRRFEFQLGVPSSPIWNCACVTTGDETRLLFSGSIREKDMPRGMLRFLVEQGIPVEVESNLED